MANSGSKAGKEKVSAPRKRKRGRRRRPADEVTRYVLRVMDWDYYYSLRPSDPKSLWDRGLFSELATLTFAADVIRPEGGKYPKAQATLSAKEGMLEETSSLEPVRVIGSLTANGEELHAYVFVPQERLAELTAIAQSGRVRIISFSATRLRYRSAEIHNISVSTREDEDDW